MRADRVGRIWLTLAIGLSALALGVLRLSQGDPVGGTALLLIGAIQLPLAAQQANSTWLTSRQTVLAVAAGFFALGSISLGDAFADPADIVSFVFRVIAGCGLLGAGLWLGAGSRRI